MKRYNHNNNNIINNLFILKNQFNKKYLNLDNIYRQFFTQCRDKRVQARDFQLNFMIFRGICLCTRSYILIASLILKKNIFIFKNRWMMILFHKNFKMINKIILISCRMNISKVLILHNNKRINLLTSINKKKINNNNHNMIKIQKKFLIQKINLVQIKYKIKSRKQNQTLLSLKNLPKFQGLIFIKKQ